MSCRSRPSSPSPGSRVPMTDSKPPIVFIAYSLEPESNKQWVLKFAEDLRARGVDAQLDQYHLKLGHDVNHFMEQMVSRPDVHKVLLVCTNAYKKKCDERRGGVGAEAQLISSK